MQIKRLLSCLASSLDKKHDILNLLTFQSHKMYCMGALENMYRLELTFRALNKKITHTKLWSAVAKHNFMW